MRTKDENGDGWSLSLNYRSCSGYLLSNLKSILFQSDSIEFLIRDILENVSSYENAVKKLANTSIISPCYLVITGPKQGEGVLLTRDRDTDVKRLNLCDLKDKLRFITQTNIDHWENKVDKDWASGDDLLLNSIERRTKSQDYLKTMEYKDKGQFIEDLFTHLFTPPILNYQTIYSTMMCVSEDYFETRVIKPSKFHLEQDSFYKK